MNDGWILCSEQLPEPNVPVLIVVCHHSCRHTTWKHIEIGEISETGSWMLSGEWWYEKDSEEIVCWQSLPKMPGEEAAENGEMERDHSR